MAVLLLLFYLYTHTPKQNIYYQRIFIRANFQIHLSILRLVRRENSRVLYRHFLTLLPKLPKYVTCSQRNRQKPTWWRLFLIHPVCDISVHAISSVHVVFFIVALKEYEFLCQKYCVTKGHFRTCVWDSFSACVQLSYVGFYCVSVVFFLSLCLYPPISWYTVLCEFK